MLTCFILQMKTATGIRDVAVKPNGHLIGFGLNELRIRSAAETSSVRAMIDTLKYLNKVISTPLIVLQIKIHYYDLYYATSRHSDFPNAVCTLRIRFGIIWRCYFPGD